MITGRVIPLSSAQIEAIEASINTQAAAAIRPRMERLARMMETEIRTEVAARFKMDRPPNRRNPPGSRRLINSFRATVEDSPTLPISVSLRTIPGVNLAKINALNSGSRAHEIRAVNGPKLVFPWAKAFTRRRAGRSTSGAKYAAYGRSNFAAPRVWHPGTRGTGFIEKAVNRAVRKL